MLSYEYFCYLDRSSSHLLLMLLSFQLYRDPELDLFKLGLGLIAHEMYVSKTGMSATPTKPAKSKYLYSFVAHCQCP